MKLRRELSKLAAEVEKLKGRREKMSQGPGPPEPTASLIRMLAERLQDKLASYFSGNDFESIMKCSPKRIANL